MSIESISSIGVNTQARSKEDDIRVGAGAVVAKNIPQNPFQDFDPNWARKELELNGGNVFASRIS